MCGGLWQKYIWTTFNDKPLQQCARKRKSPLGPQRVSATECKGRSAVTSDKCCTSGGIASGLRECQCQEKKDTSMPKQYVNMSGKYCSPTQIVLLALFRYTGCHSSWIGCLGIQPPQGQHVVRYPAIGCVPSAAVSK